MPAPGSWSTTAKKISSGAGSDSIVPSGAIARSGSAMPTVFPAASSSLARRCSQIAVPPRTAKASTMIEEGISSTPSTNCRMVRPREIFAVNTPTKGAQLTHQAQ